MMKPTGAAIQLTSCRWISRWRARWLYPQLNTRYDDAENLLYRSARSIWAGDPDAHGLCPVILTADRLSIWDLAGKSSVSRAPQRPGSREEAVGLDITLSSSSRWRDHLYPVTTAGGRDRRVTRSRRAVVLVGASRSQTDELSSGDTSSSTAGRRQFMQALTLVANPLKCFRHERPALESVARTPPALKVGTLGLGASPSRRGADAACALTHAVATVEDRAAFGDALDTLSASGGQCAAQAGPRASTSASPRPKAVGSPRRSMTAA